MLTPGNERTHGLAFVVAAAGIAVFSAMDVLMKGLVLAIGTHAALFWRNLVGVGITGTMFALRGGRWPERGVLRVHLIRGGVTTVMAVLFFWGLARLPMAQAIALSFIAPLAALFLSALILGERVQRRTILASALALAGVGLILTGQARSTLGPKALWGALAVMGSALCYAWNIVLMRQQALVAGPAEIAFFQSATVTLLLGAAAPLLTTGVPHDQWPALAGAALLATVSAMLLAFAYARAPASHLAPTEYTAFLWAAAFGWLVFGERLSPWTMAGAAAIVIACLIAARTRVAPVSETVP